MTATDRTTTNLATLEADLLSHFADSDPKGPEVSPINSLHRGHDGYITLHSPSVDGSWSPSVSVRADELESWFPQLANALDLERDSYFSVNGFALPGECKDRGSATTSAQIYRASLLRYLCSVVVDIDCYNLDISIGQAIGQAVDAAKAGKIPMASAYVDSGRGLWLFWFLHDEDNVNLPPRADRRTIPVWTAIEREVLKLFAVTGADANAMKTTQLTRIPGSINSKSGSPVTWLRTGKTYSLTELSKYFNVKIDSVTREIVTKRTPRRVNGWNALNKGRLDQFEALRQLRGGFKEGHRHHAQLIYTKLLKSNRMRCEEVIAAVECLALECIPPDSAANASKTVISYWGRSRGLKYKDRTIVDALQVTVEESDQLRVFYGERAWSWASTFGPPRLMELPDASGKSERAEKIRARRTKLMELFKGRRRGTIRWFARELSKLGHSSSARTVHLDLAALNLRTSATTVRDNSRRILEAQARMTL